MKNEVWDVCRELINSGASDALIGDVSVIHKFNGPKAILRFLQGEVYPDYFELPISERFQAAVHFAGTTWHNATELLKFSLSNGSLSKEVLTYANNRGETLLHHVVRGLAWRSFRPTRLSNAFGEGFDPQIAAKKVDPRSSDFAWRGLIREVVTAGAPIHATDARGRTPLVWLIEHSCKGSMSSNTGSGPFFTALERVLNN